MFKRRWYDNYHTLALAVSMLENTTADYRSATIDHTESVLMARYPELFEQYNINPNWFWSLQFNNRRHTLDDRSWKVIEMIRYIPDEQKNPVGDTMLRFLYDLEGAGNPSFSAGTA